MKFKRQVIIRKLIALIQIVIFLRTRKLPMDKVLTGIIEMGSGSLTNELLDLFGASADTATSSAFVQQRKKIKPEAFKNIFDRFSCKLMANFKEDMPILLLMGLKYGRKPYNLLHINALYNINHSIYHDVIIQKSKEKNEHSALQEMVDRSALPKALVIADRVMSLLTVWLTFKRKDGSFLFELEMGLMA